MDIKEKIREKFIERSIILSSIDMVSRAVAALNNAPIDVDRPLQFVLREQVKKRSIDANSYYWLRLGEIAEQAYFNGRKFNSDVWHEYCKRNIMPSDVTLKDGTVISKYIEVPRGEPAIISTTQLERKCFAEYITAVEAFGASLGVLFSADPRKYGK